MRNSLELFRGNRFPVFGMMDEFDQMFERAFRTPWNAASEKKAEETAQARSSTSSEVREWFQPEVDIEEGEQAYFLSVDLPGVRKEDIKIDLMDNRLTISGERKREQERKMSQGAFYGRSYGRFQRTFMLPQTVDASRVEAHLEDGVLRVAIPKAEAAKPRSIEIQSGQTGFFSKLVSQSPSSTTSEAKTIDAPESKSTQQ